MDEKVVPLFGGPAGARPEIEVNEKVVRTLRQLLALAENGELTGLAAACTRSSGDITTVLEIDGNRFAMSHALGALWWRFQQRMFDDSTPAQMPGDPHGT